MPEEDASRALETLGLTGKEARAYLGLLRSGVSTAQQVSVHLGVQYPAVYRILQSLNRKDGSRSLRTGRTATGHGHRGSSRRRLVRREGITSSPLRRSLAASERRRSPRAVRQTPISGSTRARTRSGASCGRWSSRAAAGFSA